jgi:hypothetical protein
VFLRATKGRVSASLAIGPHCSFPFKFYGQRQNGFPILVFPEIPGKLIFLLHGKISRESQELFFNK